MSPPPAAARPAGGCTGPAGDDRFTGRISGFGTSCGLRLVVGDWRQSRFGCFADVMIQHGDGHRVLLAPSEEIARYVAATYRFDEVRVGAVEVRDTPDGWQLSATWLQVNVRQGRRTGLGWLLRAVPSPLAAHPWWVSALDPIARLALRGVRTRGTARAGRREFYGALDVHRIDAVRGCYEGEDLGSLTDVRPDVTFGFGSVPRRPSTTRIVTTVRRGGSAAEI